VCVCLPACVWCGEKVKVFFDTLENIGKQVLNLEINSRHLWFLKQWIYTL